jgi:hypothetical protein
VSVGALNGFNGLVTLGVSGLPPGASASFTLGTIAGSGSSTMTVATSPSTPAGSYPLTVTGTSGSTVHSQVVTLAVTAPPDFALSVTPASQSARRGTPAKYTVTVTPLNGFASTVALTASGSPSGISISLSPSSLASGTAVLTASGSKVGTFTITVTGKGGGVVHTASVRFTVTR